MRTKVTHLFKDFLSNEQSSGVVLIIATIISLLIANSGIGSSYVEFWQTKVGTNAGGVYLNLSVEHWVNDALMAIFFLLIGLEVEREIYIGELSNLRNAMLPIFAAIGGMVVPAAFHYWFNAGTPTQGGFGIPMATDIAFALGVLSLVGSRAPASLKIFLAALAIIDDLGAVVIIALFYTADLSFIDLAAAAGCVALMLVLNRLRVMSLLVYLLIGVAMWVFMYRSGVHATLAGVMVAFCIPIATPRGGGESPLHRLEHALHKPVAFLVLPVFAFANAGVSLTGLSADALLEPLVLGTATALLLGKLVGVMAGAAVVILPGLAQMPTGARWGHMLGVSLLCGIGFTMSLFIGLLAYDDVALQDRVKIGVLAGSILAGCLGYLVLRSLRRDSRSKVR